MSDPIFKLQLLARAELALTEIHAKRAASRSAYFMVTLVLLLAGFAMLNVAAFLALQQQMSGPVAALLVALGDVVLAATVFFQGQKSGPSVGEEQLATELREMAYREVSADVDEVKGKLSELTSEVKGIGEGLSNATGVIRLVLGMLKK